MTPRRLLTLLVVLLAVTAGCLGGADSDAGSDGAAPTDTASDGPTDETRTLTDAETVLRDAGSFTAEWRYAGTDQTGTESSVEYTYRVNTAEGRSHVSFASSVDGEGAGVGGWEQYSTGGVTYARYGDGEEAVYQATDAEDGAAFGEALARAAADERTDLEDLTRAGSETYDGVRVDRYEMSGVDAAFLAAAGVGADQGDVDVTDFEYVVLVDRDGLARYQAWSYAGVTGDGTRVSAEWEYALSDVGGTAVEEPEWLDEAREQTGQ